MRRLAAARQSARKWGGSNLFFGKQKPRHANAPAFSTSPHCSAVDNDFDHTDSLTLDRQDGRLQRVTLSEAA